MLKFWLRELRTLKRLCVFFQSKFVGIGLHEKLPQESDSNWISVAFEKFESEIGRVLKPIKLIELTDS